jgi:hypothetical protein
LSAYDPTVRITFHDIYENSDARLDGGRLEEGTPMRRQIAGILAGLALSALAGCGGQKVFIYDAYNNAGAAARVDYAIGVNEDAQAVTFNIYDGKSNELIYSKVFFRYLEEESHEQFRKFIRDNLADFIAGKS